MARAERPAAERRLANSLGRHKEAIADCDKAIEINPQLAPAYAHRAEAKNSLDRHGEAIEDCDEAIRLETRKMRLALDRVRAYTDFTRGKAHIT